MKGRVCFMTCAGRQEQLVVQRRQATCLLKAGYDVSFIVADDLTEDVVDGIHYYPVGTVKGNYIKRFLMFSKRVGVVAKAINADIYQTETPDLLGVCTKLKKAGKKVFFSMLEGHPYTLYTKLHLPKLIVKLIVNLMVLRMRKQLSQLDYVFGVSDDIMTYLSEWGLERALLLGNFPEVDWNFSLSKEEYMSRESRAVYYGHIPKESRQELVFNALSNIPEIKYLLAGKFWNQAYKHSLSQHPFWERVEFIDGFDRKELPVLLDRCTISNVARDLSNTKSSNGSLGILKIFESMERALPLVLPDLPVYRDMVKKYNCGVLVDINSSSSIEKGIRSLLDNKEEAYQMGQNGRMAVIKEYSWDNVSKSYLEIITA